MLSQTENHTNPLLITTSNAVPPRHERKEIVNNHGDSSLKCQQKHLSSNK